MAANFDARIKVLLDAQQAYKEIAKLEKNIGKVFDTKTQQQVTKFAEERRKITGATVRGTEKQLKTDLRLLAAAQRRANLEKSLKRAGATGEGAANKEAAERIANAIKAGNAAKKNLGIQQAVNALLEKELLLRREINRTDAAQQNVGRRNKVGANFDQRIALLKAAGAQEKALQRIEKERLQLSQLNSKKQTDLAREQLAVVEDLIKAQERLFKPIINARTGASSPIGGREGIAGSPKDIAAIERKNKALQRQGLALRRLAKAFDPVIKKTAELNKVAAVPALPNSRLLGAEARGIQRLETPAERELRFSQVLERSKKRNAALDKERVADNKRLVSVGKQLAKQEEKSVENSKQKAKFGNEEFKLVKKTNAERKKGGGGRLGAAAIGVGFPLLFGGGPGSIIGGAVGGLAGGKKAGFELSVFFSALGSVLDRLGQSAIDTGTALLKPTTNLEQLTAALGITGTGLKSNIELLQELGLASVASATAIDEFESKYGKGTADTLRNLGKEFIDFQNAITTLGIRISALLAGPLGGLLNLLAKAAGSAGNAEVLRQLEQNLSSDQRKKFQSRLRELTGGAGISGNISDSTVKALSDEFDPEATDRAKKASEARLKAEKAISEEIKRQVDVAKLSAEVEQGKLTNRRDNQATLQGSLAVQQRQNELEKIQLNLANETEKTKLRLLGLEEDLAKAQLDQAKAAQENARIQAERAIQRDLLNNQISQQQISNQLLGIQQQSFALLKGAAEEYEFAQLALSKRLQTDESILETQRQLALVGVNEVEVQNAINQTFNDRLNLLRQTAALRQEELRQAEEIRKVERLRFEQSLKQIQSDAQRSAASTIRQTDPENVLRTQAAGFGFFGDSELFAENRLADSAAQLEAYNEQIGFLQTRIKELQNAGVDPDKILPLQDSLRTVTATRDAFQELQPEIDAAAIKQARFNDAFKLVAPIAQNALNGIQAVVAGTKTAEEAFADFLKSIADLLLKTAAEMIATYIAIGIARQFAGVGGDTGQGSAGFGKGAPDLGAAAGIPRLAATGGRTMQNLPYVVGEKGAELFVPGKTGTIVPADVFEATRQAIAGNGPEGGNSDAFEQNSVALGSSSSTNKENTLVREMGMRDNEPIDVRYESTVINSVEYVTAEQFQQGIRSSVNQSRASVYKELRNKPATRAGVGV